MKTLQKLLLSIGMLLLCTFTSIAQCDFLCSLTAGTNKTSLCPGNPINIGTATCLTLCKAGCTYSLSWSPSGGTNCTATVSPTTTTTYTLTATLSGNCCPFGASGSCNIPPGSTCANGIQKTSTMTVTVNSSGCRIVSPLLGVEENSNFLTISPNPNSGIFKTTISQGGWSMINLEKSVPLIAVYDNTGKLVLDKEVLTIESEIDITSLAKGIYFIRIIDGENILAVKKVVHN